jgi:hypothetical protein
MSPSTNNLNRLSCIAENEYGNEQSRLYQINSYEDPSTILIPIILGIFFLTIILSIVAISCGCRARQKRKRSSKINGFLVDKEFFFFSFSEKTSDCLRCTLFYQ